MVLLIYGMLWFNGVHITKQWYNSHLVHTDRGCNTDTAHGRGLVMETVYKASQNVIYQWLKPLQNGRGRSSHINRIQKPWQFRS